MTALQNLENDHVHILRLTHVMERMIHVKANNPDHFYTVTDLIRYFADGFHHAKEEKLLFPVLEQKGFSTMQGPVAVMLTEHQMGRSFTQGILKHLRSFEKGKNTDLRKVYTNMQSYIDLLRNHISKEDNILFRMADQVLSQEEKIGLAEQFAEAELNADPKFGLDAAKRMIRELENYYN
jgi:hemerythrin-like domain-containing protein